MTKKKVIVLTIGTGNLDQLKSSLLVPVSKSIQDGTWKKAVLLPSKVTTVFADFLVERNSNVPFQIETLPSCGMENDADACFEHFDKVLGTLETEGYNSQSITIDFTRGTKAMSAALVLAAARRDIPNLRYMVGCRDDRGMVLAGTEKIVKINPTLATGRRRLDDAFQMMKHGDFTAVLGMVPDPASPSFALLPESLGTEAALIWKRASFLAAWDRLDYYEASNLAQELDYDDAIKAKIKWVDILATKPCDLDHCAMANWLRYIGCDLFANGRRRIRDGHF